MSDVEFFWDPVCPWAWLTSRWVTEVANQRPLDVDWRFICLRLVNEQRDYDREFPQGYSRGHMIGMEILRAAAALRESEGRERVASLYTAVGKRIHTEGRRGELQEEGTVPAFLESLGVPASIAAEAHNDSWDDELRAETNTALERTGGDVGTPIITWSPPDGPSFFGPVISRIPRGFEALDLWDSITRLAKFEGFAELKCSIRERPDFT